MYGGAPSESRRDVRRGGAADLNLSDQDIDGWSSRLHEILGPMPARNRRASVGGDPEAAREFVRLGATGLTSVAPAERPGEHSRRPGPLHRPYIAQARGDRGADTQALRRGTRVQFPFGVHKPDLGIAGSQACCAAVRSSPAPSSVSRSVPPNLRSRRWRHAVPFATARARSTWCINIGALKSGDDALVLRDIRAVVEDCVDGGAVCKVILETALLTDDEKRRASELARQAPRPFRQDVDRFLDRRRDSQRRGINGRSRARCRHGGQGVRRYQFVRRCEGNDRGGSNAPGCERQHRYRTGSKSNKR